MKKDVLFSEVRVDMKIYPRSDWDNDTISKYIDSLYLNVAKKSVCNSSFALLYEASICQFLDITYGEFQDRQLLSLIQHA